MHRADLIARCCALTSLRKGWKISMGSSLRMRRVASSDLARGLQYLEDGFTATKKKDVFLAERESGVLCSLGEDWGIVNVVLTGEEYPRTGQQVLPVLGGNHIGSMGSPVDVLLWLDVAEVREAHEFLDGIDFRELIERRRRDLGRALDGLTDIVAEHLEGLRRFYRLAAQTDQAVVKRLYAP
jgi:hypothetical protein